MSRLYIYTHIYIYISLDDFRVAPCPAGEADVLYAIGFVERVRLHFWRDSVSVRFVVHVVFCSLSTTLLSQLIRNAMSMVCVLIVERALADLRTPRVIAWGGSLCSRMGPLTAHDIPENYIRHSS